MQHALSYVLILLTAAVLVVVVFKKLALPALLGYLFAGVLLGSSVLNLAQTSGAMQGLAEFGVVFLMFSIGLEFSLPKLTAMRRTVFLIGGTQVVAVLVACVLAAIAWQFWQQHGGYAPEILKGIDWRTGVVLGGALAMSSTAIVVKALADQLQLDTGHGRTVVGVLLFQDLAVVLLLVWVPAISKPADTLLLALALAGLKGALLLTLLLKFGQFWMLRLFDLIAKQRSRELFTLTVLLITLGLAWLTELVGLSLALGAFVAGMLISETPYRHAVEEDIKPFRDVLLGLFFLTLGAQLDVWVIIRQPLWVAACFVLPMLLKAALVFVIVRGARFGAASTDTAARSALALCCAGEFGFVLLNLANGSASTPSAPINALLNPELAQVLLAAMVLSMMAAPILLQHSQKLTTLFTRHMGSDTWMTQALQLHQHTARSMGLNNHVLVLGYGRSGQATAQVLRACGQTVLALDLDPDRVREARAAGHAVEYGDATRPDTLELLAISKAKAVVLSFADSNAQHKVLLNIRALNVLTPVIARTHDDADSARLKAAGASDVVPELAEGSLMLASHALLRLGVPMRTVLAQVQAARGNGYQGLAAYFHGSDDREDHHAHLHTVVLHAQAWAVGKTVAQCTQRLEAQVKHTLHVKTVRGSLGELLNAQDLCEADTAWVLEGSAVAVSAAEAVLLAG